MALTQEERQIIEHGKKQGKTKEQSLAALAKYREQSESTPLQPMGFLATLQDIPSDIAETVEGVTGAFAEGREKVGETVGRVVEGETSPASGTLQTIGEGIRTGARAIGETVMGAGKTLFSPGREQQIATTFENAVTPILQSELTQNAIRDYQVFAENNPEAARNVSAGFGILEGALELGVPGAGRVGSRATQSALDTAGRATRRVTDPVTKPISRFTTEQMPSYFKTKFKLAPEGTSDEIIRIMTDNTKDSIIANKSTMNFLDKMARRNGVSSDEYLQDFIRQGGIPDVVDGEKASFTSVINNFDQRQMNLSKSINEDLAKRTETTTLDDIAQRARADMQTSPQIGTELEPSLKELDRFMASLKTRYGDEVNPLELNEIRVQMNRKTGAFKGEQYTQDTENAIGDVVRNRINEITGDDLIKRANQEHGKLREYKNLANKLNNEKIRVSDDINSLGSLAGVMSMGAVGGMAAGTGGLIIAALAARKGSRALASFVRSKKFSSEAKQKLFNEIKRDEELVDQLIKRADEADKKALERAFSGD